METEVTLKSKDSEASKSPVVKTARHRPIKDRVPWQRLALSLFGIVIVALQWRWGVYHLYSLPPASYSSFSSMTNNASYVIGAIVIFMITGKLVYDWKNQTTSTVIEKGEQIFEHLESKEEKVITVRTEGGAKAFADDIE